MESCVCHNQSADYLDTLICDGDKFPPLLRRPYRLEEHQGENAVSDLSVEDNVSCMCVVVPRLTKLIHNGNFIDIEVLHLPALTPGNPYLIALKALRLAYKMQDGLPAVQVGAKVSPNHL